MANYTAAAKGEPVDFFTVGLRLTTTSAELKCRLFRPISTVPPAASAIGSASIRF